MGEWAVSIGAALLRRRRTLALGNDAADASATGKS